MGVTIDVPGHDVVEQGGKPSYVSYHISIQHGNKLCHHHRHYEYFTDEHGDELTDHFAVELGNKYPIKFGDNHLL